MDNLGLDFPNTIDDPDDPDSVIVETEEEFDTPDEEALEREHFDNIIEDFDEDYLSEIAINLMADHKDDEESRSKWKENYKKGLESITPQEEDVSANASRNERKLTQVIHPVIAEAATQFQARAIGELFPPEGPVGTVVLGESTEDLADQATRVAVYMNYQLTEEMEEYFPELDQMLFHLPLVGHTFKKAYYDPALGRVTSRFVQAEHFVINNSATDLASASRYSEIIQMSRQKYNELVQEDFYAPIPSSEASDEFEDLTNDSAKNLSLDDDDLTLIECHVYLDLEHEVEADENEPKWPYIVTVHSGSQKVVRVARNWSEDDPKHKKIVWFVGYKFLPGLGFYGFGLYHVIGGLGKAATGALRSLLDAAAYSNMQGGFKLKGRVRGGEVNIAPGQFVDIDSAVDDINKAIMTLPFKEPSQTMMTLLTYVVDTAKSYANSTETKISDANQNTPVGTTVALLEEKARVFSAIHKRCHYSQKKEFRLIAMLNGLYAPDRYPFSVKGENRYVLRADFSAQIDVVPVSDPSTFSSTQRIAQAQGMLQMSQAYPEFHHKYKALQRMYEAMRVPNYDDVLFDPTKAERMDPVAENVSLMHQQPVKAFEDQDHTSHIAVLDDWFKRLPKQAQPIYMQAYIAHRAEHMALLYRVQMQAQLGAALPPLPNYRDPTSKAIPTSAIMDAKISAAAAQVVNQAQLQPLGPEPPAGEGDPSNDPLAQARLMIQVETESIKAKSEADIQARMMKAQMEAQIRQKEAMMEMQIDSAKAAARLRDQQVRSAHKADADEKKLQTELEAIWTKADSDIGLARQRMNDEMQKDAIRFEEEMRQQRIEANAKLD
jgi:hypothetical protein